MTEEEKELINHFKIINNKGFIKSTTKSFGGIGLVFEKELGKQSDAMFFLDYHGIELKCISEKSKYPLYLFTAAFDGPRFPEINYIVQKYGYYDKDYPNQKVLYELVNSRYARKPRGEYSFKLDINPVDEKIYLKVYNKENKLVDKSSFVYYDTIRDHLLLKLKTLAVIKGEIKRDSDYPEYKYKEITLYHRRDIHVFWFLLSKGVIEVTLISRISKSGDDSGRYRNKNLVFSINKKEIKRLFKEVYHESYD